MKRHRKNRAVPTAGGACSAERLAKTAAILLLSLTIFCVIFYRLNPSASVSDSANHESHSKDFSVLNETLSSLKKDLLIIQKNQALDTGNSKFEGGNLTLPRIEDVRHFPQRKALLYTMDSIHSYESASKQGGAAGEILVRKSLEKIFKELNVDLDVKKSDADFESSDTSKYDIILVDPWTWAAKGWVPKEHLVGMDSKIYVLDFFGSKRLRGSGLDIPPSRFLTAYNTSPPNSFLGYFLDDQMNRTKTVKKSQGIIWGKDVNHYEGKTKLLKALADRILLLSTASSRVFHDHNIRWLGHQSPEQWNVLLSQSKFLLGMGDPLLGPSAIDAVTAGCMYINPIYNIPVIHNDHTFTSQHPHAAETIGEPYVCSYNENDYVSLQKCVRKSMNMELIPYIPLEFTKEAYRQRVIKIFGL